MGKGIGLKCIPGVPILPSPADCVCPDCQMVCIGRCQTGCVSVRLTVCVCVSNCLSDGVSVCQTSCLSVQTVHVCCLSVCLSVCQTVSVCLSVCCLSVCLAAAAGCWLAACWLAAAAALPAGGGWLAGPGPGRAGRTGPAGQDGRTDGQAGGHSRAAGRTDKTDGRQDREMGHNNGFGGKKKSSRWGGSQKNARLKTTHDHLHNKLSGPNKGRSSLQTPTK